MLFAMGTKRRESIKMNVPRWNEKEEEKENMEGNIG